MPTRCGYVSIVGKPNTGKSSILNALAGRKLSIVSSKPGTTRHRVHGAVTKGDVQALFIDAPGLSKPKSALDRILEKMVSRSVEGIDAIVFVSDDRGVQESDRRMLTTIRLRAKDAPPVILCLNKMDRVNGKGRIAALIDSWKDLYPWSAVVLTSVARKKGLDKLWAAIAEALPEAPFETTDDDSVALDDKLYAADVVREKVLRLVNAEVPHAVAVVISRWEDRENCLTIGADLVVEKDNQKRILIGAGGGMIKMIGTRARQDLEQVWGCKVYLELFVKVREKWRDSASRLAEYGYQD
ncbi:MAG: GTPase Era [Planctomycetes bacterium]|nr:GTPase Era [Planctomycetota bacterium]